MHNYSTQQKKQSITPSNSWLVFSPNKSTFLHGIYKHCFLPMLLFFAMKCCTKMPCPLPHNHYCCSLPSLVCLPNLRSVHASSHHPFLAHHHLCYVQCWCFFYFFLFLWYVTFLCDSILACLCTYFLIRSSFNCYFSWFYCFLNINFSFLY